MVARLAPKSPEDHMTATANDITFVKALSRLDATALVVGSTIGS